MERRYDELRRAVEAVEIVDAHAHNIVAVDSSFPFMKCFTEAEGDALSLAPQTLSFKRNLRDIAKLYGCEASLEGVEAYRRSAGLQKISSKCFGGARISAVLIDDGIEFDKMHNLEWHGRVAPYVGRILRIERLAEKILEEVPCIDSFADKIVGLKSIVAYRSGLEIDTRVSKKAAEDGFVEDLNGLSEKSIQKPIRIQNKYLIDYIFTLSLEVALLFDLPMQIHTGFGDKDLDLRLSNPLHLRSVLEDKRFSKSRIVLLHASYPFSKEASYLALVYPQIYLDFGLAVPQLSVHGMTSAIKELLELAPIKKVMFSSDGYAFPETYYLGARRARESIFSVLSSACIDGDLTIPEAVEAIKDIFRGNALQFYKLTGTVGPVDSEESNAFILASVDGNSPPEGIAFVRIIWVDTSGQHRCRVIPAKRFYEVVRNNGVGLTFASMGMSSFSDGPAEGSNLTAVGEIRSGHEEMVLSDMHLKPGEAWEYCPREALRKEMNAGFENEFYLLKNGLRDGKPEWMPFDFTPYCSTSGFDAISHIFQEIDSALQSMNISVEQLHAESGKGQFEIALGYTVCTQAADNLIFVREAIRAVARKHSLLATFVPNYDRIQPNTWSGAYHCWGKENREAPLRTASPPGVLNGLVSNFEIKSFDGCANPHLGLAAIMAAGIDGLRRSLRLPKPTAETNPSGDDSLARLPIELSESVEALEKDEVLKAIIGENLLTAVVGVRKAEIEYYSKNSEASKNLIHRY
ncbi:hypothetical protein QJS10_CPB18g01692 [Acorus calamus]|uniref:GS catalytic domain-containing protein n=1 Tax=Acorus calamus TaxID=4465 RepID=A0AAV9CP44_ACOCL|nr:hypothetical protein QJS10_CPB18g01692 [Acorus calamus]